MYSKLIEAKPGLVHHDGYWFGVGPDLYPVLATPPPMDAKLVSTSPVRSYFHHTLRLSVRHFSVSLLAPPKSCVPTIADPPAHRPRGGK